MWAGGEGHGARARGCEDAGKGEELPKKLAEGEGPTDQTRVKKHNSRVMLDGWMTRHGGEKAQKPQKIELRKNVWMVCRRRIW